MAKNAPSARGVESRKKEENRSFRPGGGKRNGDAHKCGTAVANKRLKEKNLLRPDAARSRGGKKKRSAAQAKAQQATRRSNRPRPRQVRKSSTSQKQGIQRRGTGVSHLPAVELRERQSVKREKSPISGAKVIRGTTIETDTSDKGDSLSSRQRV